MTTGVILLHGVGGTGAGLAALGRAFGVTTLAPDGPEAFGAHPEGRQWFSIDGITDETRPARIRAARPALDALIDGFAAQGISRLVLFGFSQGAIMALDALARGKVAEVVAVAGRLAFDGTPAPRPGARALILGGEADHVVPARHSQAAAERLLAAGVDVTCLIQPGAGHQITPRVVKETLAFLA